MIAQTTCFNCGIPFDSSIFDESSIQVAPRAGQEIILAHYHLHRNQCGILMGFSQYIPPGPGPNTPGYRWEIRCNGQPRDPYLGFEYILNPWGLGGFPVKLKLEEGCLVELVIRNVGGAALTGLLIGGRITGHYWYNADYGGSPNRL